MSKSQYVAYSIPLKSPLFNIQLYTGGTVSVSVTLNTLDSRVSWTLRICSSLGCYVGLRRNDIWSDGVESLVSALVRVESWLV